jgi:RNA polymerase sigma-70 factor (ECF subfamily)
MSQGDEELAASAQRGDRDAFASLVALYQRKTFGLALQMLRSPDDAADAAQEAFMRCYASLDRYDRSQSFGGWLYRIAYNHCLDVLRQRKRSPQMVRGTGTGDTPVDSAPDDGPGVEELVERSESAEQLRAAMDGLSAEHRHILILRYTADLPYDQMAKVVGVSESTVTMRLYHAKRALRARLKASGEDHHAS